MEKKEIRNQITIPLNFTISVYSSSTTTTTTPKSASFGKICSPLSTNFLKITFLQFPRSFFNLCSIYRIKMLQPIPAGKPYTSHYSSLIALVRFSEVPSPVQQRSLLDGRILFLVCMQVLEVEFRIVCKTLTVILTQ